MTATIDLAPRDLDAHRWIYYAYDTVADEHFVQVCDMPKNVTGRRGLPGFVLNALVPYRENREVKELIAWLSR